MEFVYGRPVAGELKKKTIRFLREASLDFDESAEFTVCLMENGEILATGSRQGKVLKCLAVLKDIRGSGLAARIVTELVKDAVSAGFAHLFLYTKPESGRIFEALGFYPVAGTEDVLLLENVKNGAEKFVSSLDCPIKEGKIGCIVANCNPMTNGHLYLAETAARSCDFLHLFIPSEDCSRFPADVRMMLAKRAVSHLRNVAVHPTGDYLTSAATFPDYFIRDKARVENIRCMLDLVVFARKFAGPLHITTRFVGSEPFSRTADCYNRVMKEYLPSRKIEVEIVPRLEIGSSAVSAGRVRELLDEGKLEKVRELVPLATYDYLKKAGWHERRE
ncbi:[Citrate [pro-3S]-lyase] ligase [Ruminococcaceae bacterium BL-6]|jgi:[citrate (pro-3S)-lyase] ligase|nr:[Citrate [pro-3S]-lyase] ligase [Ruminococcaceae bacterium BL-6]HBC27972.1 [citrate (pro-3S)-lyase] ligase [Oscillospiraceae bacterium]